MHPEEFPGSLRAEGEGIEDKRACGDQAADEAAARFIVPAQQQENREHQLQRHDRQCRGVKDQGIGFHDLY